MHSPRKPLLAPGKKMAPLVETDLVCMVGQGRARAELKEEARMEVRSPSDGLKDQQQETDPSEA